jgi:monofunctional biosynthetic peptidoglycan transglycosylase
MKVFIVVSILGLLVAGCAVSPDSENTQSGIADKEISKADEQAEQNTLPGQLLFDFDEDSQAWNTVDDRVMGGVSNSSGAILDEGTLLFSGTMSLESNGGFSSLRSSWEPVDLSGADGLLIRVLGDGRIYRMRVRSTETGRDVSYNSFFETEAGEWTTVYISFNTMVPTIMGFQTNSGQLDPATISSFGLMLSDKQPGEFALQVDWIRAVSEDDLFPDGISG